MRFGRRQFCASAKLKVTAKMSVRPFDQFLSFLSTGEGERLLIQFRHQIVREDWSVVLDVRLIKLLWSLQFVEIDFVAQSGQIVVHNGEGIDVQAIIDNQIEFAASLVSRQSNSNGAIVAAIRNGMSGRKEG